MQKEIDQTKDKVTKKNILLFFKPEILKEYEIAHKVRIKDTNQKDASIFIDEGLIWKRIFIEMLNETTTLFYFYHKCSNGEGTTEFKKRLFKKKNENLTFQIEAENPGNVRLIVKDEQGTEVLNCTDIENLLECKDELIAGLNKKF